MDKNSDFYMPSTEFLRSYKNKLAITSQNIVEYLRFSTSLKYNGHLRQPEAIENLYYIFKEFKTIIMPSKKSLRKLLELVQKYNISSKNIFDANLAAMALSRNIKCIATVNTKDFLQIKELEIIYIKR
jgi:predicted nucleic acid-binding protein